MAKKYQVLSKSTSLYAEVENENSNPYLSHFEVVEQGNLEYTELQNEEDKEKEEEKKESSNVNDSENGKEDKIRCGNKRIKKNCKKKEDYSENSSSSSSDSIPEEKYKKKKRIIQKDSKPEKAKPKNAKPIIKMNNMSYFCGEKEISSSGFEDEKNKKLKK